MASIRTRLEQGERCWPAELALRAAGLALLCVFALAWRTDCQLIGQLPAHSCTASEFGLAAAAYGTLAVGLALTLDGAGLFRLLPTPPRALLP